MVRYEPSLIHGTSNGTEKLIMSIIKKFSIDDLLWDHKFRIRHRISYSRDASGRIIRHEESDEELIKEWATDHLQGKWSMGLTSGYRTFFVRDAKDAMLFKLTWSDILD